MYTDDVDRVQTEDDTGGRKKRKKNVLNVIDSSAGEDSNTTIFCS